MLGRKTSRCHFPGGVTGQYLGRDVPPGKSADFPGVVGNPLPLVRFRRKDRFSTPLVEKRPAPPTPWPKRSNFNFSKKSSTSHQKPIIHRGFTVTPCRLKAARHTPNNPRYNSPSRPINFSKAPTGASAAEAHACAFENFIGPHGELSGQKKLGFR